MTKEVKLVRIENGIPAERTEPVAAEHTVKLYVNGESRAILTFSPQCVEELVLGHLLSSGVIRDAGDVAQITQDGESVYAETSCGEVLLSPVLDGLSLPLTVILSHMEEFLRKSEVFFATGAVHSCALIANGRLMHFMEDIGRHNAFDKTVGAALRDKTPLGQAAVLTSGRVPCDMMTKIIRARVQIVVSRSAPTDAAVDLALRHNVTLCGFARGNRINIYTGRDRITL